MTLNEAQDLKLELKEIKKLMREIGGLAGSLPQRTHLERLEESLRGISSTMGDIIEKRGDLPGIPASGFFVDESNSGPEEEEKGQAGDEGLESALCLRMCGPGGLPAVLHALRDICRKMADHVSDVEPEQVEVWQKVAGTLNRAAEQALPLLEIY